MGGVGVGPSQHAMRSHNTIRLSPYRKMQSHTRVVNFLQHEHPRSQKVKLDPSTTLYRYLLDAGPFDDRGAKNGHHSRWGGGFGFPPRFARLIAVPSRYVTTETLSISTW